MTMSEREYILANVEDTVRIQAHECKRLKDPPKLRLFIKAWWYFLAHLLWSIFISALILGPLNQRPFPVRKTAGYLLTQSDVSTLLSVGLKTTNIMCSFLQGILAWRCAFIALERTGLTFSQLSTQISYKVGPLAPRSGLIAWISLSLILAWPAQLAAPVLSGAIAWAPNNSLQSQQGRPVEVTMPFAPAGKEGSWTRLLLFKPGRLSPGNQLLRGTGATIANMNGDNSRRKTVSQNPRRFVPELRGIPVGSLLENITVPHLRISEFNWLDTLQSVPQDVKSAVQRVGSGWFNYSRQSNPLYSFAGAVALTRRNDFSGMPTEELPQPVAVSAQTFAVLYVFHHSPDDDHLPRCSVNVDVRPSDPPVREYLHMEPLGDNRTYCIAVASVILEVGVVSCRRSARIVAESLAECQNQKFDTLEPDPLVEFSLALVPETIMQVNMMNTTGWDFKNGAEAYVKDILNVAYQGVWSATTYFISGQEKLTSNVYERLESVKAEVTAWRVWLWLASNVVLTLTGVMVCCLQSRVVRPVVRDPVLSALMMDPSNIYKHNHDGLCDVDNIEGSNKHDRLLSLNCVPRGDGQWRHDMLDFQRRSTERS